jgi:hypothetical protein
MHRSTDLRKQAAWVSLAGFVLNLIAFYPGFLNPDSINQYQESLSGMYSDWHPPVMAVLWRGLHAIGEGPAPMLVLQLGCLWGSCYLLYPLSTHRTWHLLVAGVFLAPFVQNFAGVIIKDSQMALGLLLALAIMLNAVSSQKKPTVPRVVCVALLLTYSSWIRLNALPAVLPLCFLGSWVMLRERSLGIVLSSALAFGVAVVLGLYVFNHWVLKPKPTYPEAKLFLHDLSGVFVAEKQNVFPAFLFKNPDFDTSYIRRKYTTATFDHIWWNADGLTFDHKELRTEKGMQALQRAWREAISKYLATYLSNRADGFLYHLRIKNRDNLLQVFYPRIDANPLGLVFKENIVSKVFIKYIWVQRNAPYMRPWFWLLANVVLLGLIARVKQPGYRVTYGVLLLSSLLYLLASFFVYQTDTDFRYFYWNCLACSLACCVWGLDRFTGLIPSETKWNSILAKHRAEKAVQ